MEELNDLLPVLLAAGERGELPDLLGDEDAVPQTQQVSEAELVGRGLVKWSGRF